MPFQLPSIKYVPGTKEKNMNKDTYRGTVTYSIKDMAIQEQGHEYRHRYGDIHTWTQPHRRIRTYRNKDTYGPTWTQRHTEK